MVLPGQTTMRLFQTMSKCLAFHKTSWCLLSDYMQGSIVRHQECTFWSQTTWVTSLSPATHMLMSANKLLTHLMTHQWIKQKLLKLKNKTFFLNYNAKSSYLLSQGMLFVKEFTEEEKVMVRFKARKRRPWSFASSAMKTSIQTERKEPRSLYTIGYEKSHLFMARQASSARSSNDQSKFITSYQLQLVRVSWDEIQQLSFLVLFSCVCFVLFAI